ncbi:MAG: hypothetical protein DRH08_15230, partial [Deltaproteobacteria bacterium]
MTTAALVIASISAILAIIWAKRNQNQVKELESKLLSSKEVSQQQADLLEVYRDRDQQLIQDAGEALFIFDQEDGSLLEINHQAETLLGYTLREGIHLTFKVLFSREHRQHLLRMTSKVIKQGEAEISEIKFKRKDGSKFIGEIKARTGQMKGRRIIYGSFRDVTQTTNLQLELQRHNRHLTLLNE